MEASPKMLVPVDKGLQVEDAITSTPSLDDQSSTLATKKDSVITQTDELEQIKDEHVTTTITTCPIHPLSAVSAPSELRRESLGGGILTQESIHKWKGPLLGVVFFAIGLILSVTHCIYYPKLNHAKVGDSGQQAQTLRFGTAFAFLVNIALAASVWVVYSQWLWRSFRWQALSMRGWNDAISADTSVFSLFNWELAKKAPICATMAAFAWTLSLPPFFTPATIFIYSSTDHVETIASLPYPSIGNTSEFYRYAYSPPLRPNTSASQENMNQTSGRIFGGPRTVLSLISTATSSVGEILQIDLPYDNAAYSVKFPAPIVKCEDANDLVAQQINQFLVDEMDPSDTVETDYPYFALVPTYDSSGRLTADWRTRQQSPSNAMNALYLTFIRPSYDNQTQSRYYQVCQPYYAQYDVHISQYHGVQNVTGTYTTGPAVPFPEGTTNDTSEMTLHSYSALMWVISDLLVGSLAWYNTNSSDPAASEFGVMESLITSTSLLGSQDLDAYFDLEHEKRLYTDTDIANIHSLSDQRLRDVQLARNRTLSVLIEELSFNITMSLMHNKLLTNSVNTSDLLTDEINRYSYSPYGLFIPYALANVFAFLCVTIGIISYILDGVLPGRRAEDIMHVTRNPEIHSCSCVKRRYSINIDEKGDVAMAFAMKKV